MQFKIGSLVDDGNGQRAVIVGLADGIAELVYGPGVYGKAVASYFRPAGFVKSTSKQTGDVMQKSVLVPDRFVASSAGVVGMATFPINSDAYHTPTGQVVEVRAHFGGKAIVRFGNSAEQTCDFGDLQPVSK